MLYQVHEFWNGDGDDTDKFVAIGRDMDRMRVYRWTGFMLSETQMRFPGCLRFMPYAEDKGAARMTLDQVRDKYGPMEDEYTRVLEGRIPYGGPRRAS